uniref:Uncharacterized protein n=1 Tax=candidate division WOR-3 bacterium TaxID=2052148 RepID=A0A7C2P3F9_UNCW3
MILWKKDAITYYTKVLKKPLKGGGGISPHITVKQELISNFTQEIYPHFFSFAVEYKSKNKVYQGMNSTVISEFKEYLKRNNVKYSDEDFEKNLGQIRRLLDAEISEKYQGTKGRYASLLKDDLAVKRAQEILKGLKSLKDLRDFISSKL